MPDLNVKLSIQVPSGPTVQSIRAISVSSPEPYAISLPPNSTQDAGVELSFLPAEGKGKVNVLFIQSNFYTGERDGGEILFSMGTITDKPLREPLVLLGTEIIEVLGPPQKITFKNTLPTKKIEPVEPPAEVPPAATPPAGDVAAPDGETAAPETAAAAPKEIDVTEENTAQISILIGRVEEG